MEGKIFRRPPNQDFNSRYTMKKKNNMVWAAFRRHGVSSIVKIDTKMDQRLYLYILRPKHNHDRRQRVAKCRLFKYFESTLSNVILIALFFFYFFYPINSVNRTEKMRYLI